MTYKLSASPKARKDLRNIREYISVELGNDTAAEKTVEKLILKIQKLETLPEIGAPLASRVNRRTDMRYLVCGNYNVFYRIEGDIVRVVRVLNCRMDFMKNLFDIPEDE